MGKVQQDKIEKLVRIVETNFPDLDEEQKRYLCEKARFVYHDRLIELKKQKEMIQPVQPATETTEIPNQQS